MKLNFKYLFILITLNLACIIHAANIDDNLSSDLAYDQLQDLINFDYPVVPEHIAHMLKAVPPGLSPINQSLYVIALFARNVAGTVQPLAQLIALGRFQHLNNLNFDSNQNLLVYVSFVMGMTAYFTYTGVFDLATITADIYSIFISLQYIAFTVPWLVYATQMINSVDPGSIPTATVQQQLSYILMVLQLMEVYLSGGGKL